MSYTTADGRRQVLDAVAAAADQIGIAVAYLGEAYEQLDEYAAQRLEEQLFRPVQLAYGRTRRVYGDFAARHDLPSRGFETQQPHVRAHDARGLIDSAVEAVARADGGLGGLQDSMLPIEVGDAQLRAGLEEVRVLLGEVGERARRLERTLGR
ncbi:MAG: hypothetical protein ABSH27_00985 [Solirubrobacteraceae bacterium]|jgi:hypothetical protein